MAQFHGIRRLLLFLLLLLLVRGQAFANASANSSLGLMEPKELEALFQVMESMSADAEWRSLYPNPCAQSSWPGLQCRLASDKFLHVSRLEFGYHPFPSCKKDAVFSEAIFRLSYVQELRIFHCFVHGSVVIPTGFQRLAGSLQQLSLGANIALVGEIPGDFGNLKKLQVLSLSQNSLTGQIPIQIGRLNRLLHLDLSFNFFKGRIPAALGHLTSMEVLDLSYNQLTGLIPPMLGELKMLQKLDLTSNGLSRSVPAELGNLKNLVFLALSNNNLSGRLPSSLGSLKNLQNLVMENNPMFSSLPAHLGKLKHLQELRLANSSLTGHIPVSYGRLSNLESLSLENNMISGEIPAVLGNLSHVYHMNLSGNMLTGAVPFSSEFIARLGNNLDLRNNLDLCLSTFQAKESNGNLGLHVCEDLRSKSMANHSQKSQSLRLLQTAQWQIYLLATTLVCVVGSFLCVN